MKVLSIAQNHLDHPERRGRGLDLERCGSGPERCRRGRGLGLRDQRGSALVISMIILLIVTVLGVAAMRATIIQERMASNMQDRNLAFQAAESALREGEAWLLDPANTPGAQTLQAIVATEGGAALSDWAGTQNTGTRPGLGDALAADPVFHVDQPVRIRVGIEMPPVYRNIYPVTARGVGGSEVTVVILQSNYEPH